MNIQTLATPVGRTMMALIFLLSGLSKISAYEGTQGYMDAMGVPGSLLPIVIFFEVSFSLALILGWQVRIVAFSLAGFSLVSAAIFHGNLADQMQFIMFMKNVAMAGGLLFLVDRGAGAFAMDNLFNSKGI